MSKKIKVSNFYFYKVVKVLFNDKQYPNSIPKRSPYRVPLCKHFGVDDTNHISFTSLNTLHTWFDIESQPWSYTYRLNIPIMAITNSKMFVFEDKGDAIKYAKELKRLWTPQLQDKGFGVQRPLDTWEQRTSRLVVLGGFCSHVETPVRLNTSYLPNYVHHYQQYWDNPQSFYAKHHRETIGTVENTWLLQYYLPKTIAYPVLLEGEVIDESRVE